MRLHPPCLPRPARLRPWRGASVLMSLALGLVACGPPGGGAPAPAGPPGSGMPPPSVGVVTVQPGNLALSVDLPGRLEAWRVAQVRARVPGIVAKRLFTEGALVKAGQPLFQLDASAFQAALASTEASLARAEAGVAQAQAQVQRNQPLAEAKAISAQEWLVTQTTLKQAQAEQASARAAATSARINLDYASIKAPIDGRIGRSLVTEGALVGQGDATQMALIQQTDRLYVNFTQSAADAMRLRKAFDAGALQRTGAGSAIRILLDDGSEVAQTARLLFADPTVDAATGQVSLRAELPNPQGLLLPGLFVKVRLAQASSDHAIRLPQQAVTRGAGGDSVLVLGADNKPAPRSIQIGASLGTDWVVLGGLAAGDRVVVDGFQKLRPGAAVNPVPWAAPGAAMPASAAAAASAPASAPAPAASR